MQIILQIQAKNVRQKLPFVAFLVNQKHARTTGSIANKIMS